MKHRHFIDALLCQTSYRTSNALRDRKYGKVTDTDAVVETRELADEVRLLGLCQRCRKLMWRCTFRLLCSATFLDVIGLLAAVVILDTIVYSVS